VIYIQPRDEFALNETSDKLGDMTSEFVSEFAGGGHKNYAYRVMTGGRSEKREFEVKNINLNYNASKLVNFERIRYMILRTVDEPQTVVNVHTEKKIKPKKKGD